MRNYTSLSSFIALRYVSVGRRSQLVSFMSMISISGVALGVTLLLTVLSVMNGFDRELRESILGIIPHAEIKAYDTPVQDSWDEVQAQLELNENIIASVPVLEVAGILSNNQFTKLVQVNGINPQDIARISVIGNFFTMGGLESLAEQRWGIIIGSTLASNLGVAVGDKVSLYSTNFRPNPIAIRPSQKPFTVAGIFSVGTQELDANMAIITLRSAKALFKRRSHNSLWIKTDDALAANRIVAGITSVLPQNFYSETWTKRFGEHYERIKISRTLVGFLLWLLVAVAVFNLVVSLIMIVRDKKADIAILRTMGASPGLISRIFITQGCAVGFIGTGLGIFFGILLSLTISDLAAGIEFVFDIQILSADLYVVDFLPSQIRFGDIAMISTGVFLLCMLATLYPAWRASKVQPAEALRFE